MKAFTVIAKVLAALAAIAGVVYLAATYGDKVVAWAKKMLGSCCECTCENECCCEEDDIVDETPVEEVPAEEEAAPEAEPVAEETDFEA